MIDEIKFKEPIIRKVTDKTRDFSKIENNLYSIGPFVNVEKKNNTNTGKTENNSVTAGTIFIVAYFKEHVGVSDVKLKIDLIEIAQVKSLKIDVKNENFLLNKLESRILFEIILVPKMKHDIEEIFKLNEINININFNEKGDGDIELGEPKRATRVIPPK